MKPDNTQETIYVGLDTGLPPYLPYPRFLLKMDISQTAKLLYALLLDRTTLSQRNGWQDDQGRTFIVYPIAEIAEMLDKGQTAIKAALNELDAAGLLERKRAGFSAANRLEMSRNVQSGNTQNLKSMVIQRSFPKWSVAERRKTAAASDQAAVCACAHSRYFAGGSPSGLRV